MSEWGVGKDEQRVQVASSSRVSSSYMYIHIRTCMWLAALAADDAARAMAADKDQRGREECLSEGRQGFNMLLRMK